MSLLIFVETFFMANSYFQFKQFKIEQSLAAMKVCTEACLFGALIDFPKPKSILDIGTGTGLLSLMMAQQYDCRIDAVEIDENAFEQAALNFNNSPWKNNLSLYHQSIQQFQNESLHKYELIISNPPFFADHLQSIDAAKNTALHTNLLSQDELLTAVKSLLIMTGVFFLLLPPAESEKFEFKAIKSDLFLQKRTVLYNRTNTPPFRYVSQYGHAKREVAQEKIYIRNTKGEYSEEFIALLKPYYLNL